MSRRQEVMERLCELTTEVGAFLSRNGKSFASDCFCSKQAMNFQFDPAILEFVTSAIEEKIREEEKHGKEKPASATNGSRPQTRE